MVKPLVMNERGCIILLKLREICNQTVNSSLGKGKLLNAKEKFIVKMDKLFAMIL